MIKDIDLSGEWEFCFDQDGSGIESRWYANKPKDLNTVTIPHTWQNDFPKNTNSVGFYFKSLKLSPNTKVKKFYLKFDKIFYQTTVWINGKIIGTYKGGHNPFFVDISKGMKVDSENYLCLRVASGNAYNNIDGMSTQELGIGRAYNKASFSGMWGKATLICGKKGAIKQMNVIPDIDAQKFKVELEFFNPKNFSTTLNFALTSPDGKTTTVTKDIKLDKENSSTKVSFNIKEPIRWTLTDPSLYTLHVNVENGNSASKQFGFRKFDILRGDAYLNDRIVKLRGITLTTNYPKSGAFIGEPFNLLDELKQIKEMGFNAIRSGGEPLSAEALNVCDQIGLLVILELPIYQQRSTKDGLAEARENTEAIINEFKTHPSVGVWCLGNKNGTLMLENGTKLLKFVDELDESRPIISNMNSVIIDNESFFKSDTSKVLGVTNDKIQVYNSHLLNPKMNLSPALQAFFKDYCIAEAENKSVPDYNFGDDIFHENYENMHRTLTGKILINTHNHTIIPDFEVLRKYSKSQKTILPYKSILETEKKFIEIFESEAFTNVWESSDAFIAEANRVSLKATVAKVNAFRTNGMVSGVFLNEWADINDNFAGLVNNHRDMKINPEDLKQIFFENQLLFSGLKRNPYPDEECFFNLVMLNEGYIGEFTMDFSIEDSKGKAVVKDSQKYEAAGIYNDLGEFKYNAPKSAGKYTVILKLIKDGKTLSENREDIVIFKTTEVHQDKYLWLATCESDSEVMAAMENARVIITSQLSYFHPETCRRLLEHVQESGKTLVFTDLDQKEAEFINKLESLPTIQLAISTGANHAAYHYFNDDGFFKGMDSKMVDLTSGEVMPGFSLVEIEGAKSHANAITILNERDVNQYSDVQELKLGQGKIIFHQYSFIDKVGESSLADLLMNNLLANC